MTVAVSAPTATELQAAARFFRQVKGAQLTILMFMLNFPGRAWGRDDLALYTGLSAPTVSSGLNELAVLGYVQRHARTDGWALTAMAHQAPLPVNAEPAALASPPSNSPQEGEDNGDVIEAEAAPPSNPPQRGEEGDGEVKNFLTSCSSSLTTHGVDSENVDKTTTQQRQRPNEVKKFDLGPPGAEAFRLLMSTGMAAHTKKLHGARDAIEAALEGGWTEDETLAAVEGWLDYCESPAGETIRHPGLFTSSRVRQLEAAPELEEIEEDRDSQARRYIADAYDQIVRR